MRAVKGFSFTYEQMDVFADNVLSTANERIAYLEGLVAWQDDALKSCYEYDSGEKIEKEFNSALITQAISASAETVQAFRDKLTEPLRREVAMLAKLSSYFARMHCGDDTCECHNCNLHRALLNTQATAEAYEQEVEALGAAKALEELRAVLVAENCCRIHAVNAIDEMLRATTKKEG